MDEYLGSDAQVRVQARVAALAAWIEATPGAVNGVRLLATDNPEVLGWPVIFHHLGEDGLFGFRVVTGDEMARIGDRVGAEGYHLVHWQVFLGEPEEVSPRVAGVLAQGLPAGYCVLGEEACSEPVMVDAARRLMVECGISPFPMSVLLGRRGPCNLTLIVDAEAKLAACAFCYFPYGPHSAWHRHAWGGLVAVSSAHRGRGLGTLVNALMARAAFEKLGARGLQEYISADNAASRAMVERCGLSHDGDSFACVASRAAAKFTR